MYKTSIKHLSKTLINWTKMPRRKRFTLDNLYFLFLRNCGFIVRIVYHSKKIYNKEFSIHKDIDEISKHVVTPKWFRFYLLWETIKTEQETDLDNNQFECLWARSKLYIYANTGFDPLSKVARCSAGVTLRYLQRPQPAQVKDNTGLDFSFLKMQL